MSLQSSSELAYDQKFRGKVTVALAQVARKIIDENTQTDEGKARTATAKDVLMNIHVYAERAFPIIAADPTIDSSSSDEAIITAVRNAVYALVK